MAASVPSVVELAELCLASYEDSGDVSFIHRPPRPGFPDVCLPDDAEYRVVWTRHTAWRNELGFHATLFTRRDDAAALVYRGTNDGWDVALDDAVVSFGGLPPQAEAALTVARGANSHAGVYYSGHSLGGALALIAAAHMGRPAVTFNAPGVMDSCVLSAPRASSFHGLFTAVGRCFMNSRVLNLRIPGDPVSSQFLTGLQAGGSAQTIGSFAGTASHGIRTCVEAVRARAENFQPLAL